MPIGSLNLGKAYFTQSPPQSSLTPRFYGTPWDAALDLKHFVDTVNIESYLIKRPDYKAYPDGYADLSTKNAHQNGGVRALPLNLLWANNLDAARRKAALYEKDKYHLSKHVAGYRWGVSL